jgi:uncharacterized protein
MDLRERLNRLTSVSGSESKSGEEEKSRLITDLRQRLERVLEPGRTYRKKQASPIEDRVKGKVVSTPFGEIFVAEETFPSHFRCGEMALCEILDIPTYPAHLLTRDERLKDLDLRKTLFVDTETTGLSGGTGVIAFMIGAGFFNGDGFVVRQLFMRDYSEERASLFVLKDLLDSFEFLVTFNGRQYDLPLLETRFILSRMPARVREIPHLDLLPPSRRLWKGAYENCRLVTLESRVLGMGREDDVPSEWIPQLYFDYIQTGDGGKIHRVFYHNRMDVITMVALAGRIHLAYHDPDASKPRKGVEHFALGRLFWDHRSFEKAIPCFEAALKRCDEDLAWEVMRWLSRAFKKTGQAERARSLWEEMMTWPHKKDAFPHVELAKDCEHRMKNIEMAVTYVDRALGEPLSWRPKEFDLLRRRKQRLEQKRAGREAR